MSTVIFTTKYIREIYFCVFIILHMMISIG